MKHLHIKFALKHNQIFKAFLILIITLSYHIIYSQGNGNFCSTTSTNNAPAGLLSSQSCNLFLTDLVPSINDPVLEVRVKFHVFVPTTNSNTSVWTHYSNPTTSLNAQAVLDYVNTTFSSIPVPELVFGPGVPNIGDVRIKFVLYGFHIIPDDLAYSAINNVQNFGYGDENYNVPLS